VLLVLTPIVFQFISIFIRRESGNQKINTIKSNLLEVQNGRDAYKSAFENEQSFRKTLTNIYQQDISRYQTELGNTSRALELKSDALNNYQELTLATIVAANAQLHISEEDIESSFKDISNMVIDLVTLIPSSARNLENKDALKSFSNGIMQVAEPMGPHLKSFYLTGKLYSKFIEIIIQWHMAVNLIPSIYKEFGENSNIKAQPLAMSAVTSYGKNKLWKFIERVVGNW
jgi:hypothetical protein